ncbi:hypothetical protein [Paenibacillus protaetiae]|uniref:Uncharacterized protein n=1 Tax=Paenibacillus protaetiae TaxID=2509456 RepID=A0A4P6EUU9_9BACL|nr:hypothetical protein [Paenibacillus protaetiae]QAY66446.1 hypothetical protein ET464_08515 [Paenibacillus protaetiae]
MRYPVTIAATLIGLAVCLYNYTGYDPHNMIFFMFSVPAWFVDLFYDVHDVSVMLMYILTVATWALIGYIADRIILRSSRRSRT